VVLTKSFKIFFSDFVKGTKKFGGLNKFTEDSDLNRNCLGSIWELFGKYLRSIVNSINKLKKGRNLLIKSLPPKAGISKSARGASLSPLYLKIVTEKE
jgi:hypothetical protein